MAIQGSIYKSWHYQNLTTTQSWGYQGNSITNCQGYSTDTNQVWRHSGTPGGFQGSLTIPRVTQDPHKPPDQGNNTRKWCWRWRGFKPKNSWLTILLDTEKYKSVVHHIFFNKNTHTQTTNHVQDQHHPSIKNVVPWPDWRNDAILFPWRDPPSTLGELKGPKPNHWWQGRLQKKLYLTYDIK